MKKYLSVLLCLTLLAALLAGCGGSSKSAQTLERGYYDMAEDMVAESPAAAEAASGAMDNGGAASEITLPESRKWIITMNLSAETDDLDALTAALNEKIGALKGYVEDQNIYNGSGTGRRYRSASLTVRIPADQADAFTQDVGGLANLVSQSKSVEDVTLSYVATESRMKALETEESRLLELLSQAESMEDLLAIEDRLTEVRYELESVTSQKRLYDNQIDYATVYLSIDEVQEYTPVEEPSVWERITKGFGDNLKGVGETIVNVLVWFITSLPSLIALAAVIAVVVLITRPLHRRKKAAKEAKKEEKGEEK